MTEKMMDIPQEKEFNLIEIIRKIWHNRNLILKAAALFFLLGIIVSLSISNEFTARTTMIPQKAGSRGTGGSGGLSGLASLAGINLSSMAGDELFTPRLYTKIINSIPFQKELMYTAFTIKNIDYPVTLKEYYTNELYQNRNVLQWIGKYTIGLPGLLFNSIKGGDEEIKYYFSIDGDTLEYLTPQERKTANILKRKITINSNDSDGYVDLKVEMPEALLAAQVAEKTKQLLQSRINEYKTDKAKSEYDFILARHQEAKEEFEKIQQERAIFRDANYNISSAKAKTEQDRLDALYSLSLNVFTEMSKQLEQAKIKVKEDSQNLLVIDPVTVPNRKSKPKRTIITLLFIFSGILISIGFILFHPVLIQLTDNKKVKRWVK